MWQHVHLFLEGKVLGIQQETSVWVGSPKSTPPIPQLSFIYLFYILSLLDIPKRFIHDTKAYDNASIMSIAMNIPLVSCRKTSKKQNKLERNLQKPKQNKKFMKIPWYDHISCSLARASTQVFVLHCQQACH